MSPREKGQTTVMMLALFSLILSLALLFGLTIARTQQRAMEERFSLIHALGTAVPDAVRLNRIARLQKRLREALLGYLRNPQGNVPRTELAEISGRIEKERRRLPPEVALALRRESLPDTCQELSDASETTRCDEFADLAGLAGLLRAGERRLTVRALLRQPGPSHRILVGHRELTPDPEQCPEAARTRPLTATLSGNRWERIADCPIAASSLDKALQNPTWAPILLSWGD